MKNILPISLCCLAALLCEDAVAIESDSATIHFRQSIDRIDRSYMDNDTQLNNILHLIDNSQDSTRLVVGKLHVKGTASPEGSIQFNKGLSDRRAEALLNYVGQYYDIGDASFVKEFTGRDWNGLREYILTDENVPYRGETLKVVDEIINKLEVNADEDNIRLLKNLHNGVPYQYLYRKVFPLLRYSSIEMTYRLPKIEPLVGEPTPSLNPVLTGMIYPIELEIQSTSTPRKPFYMALKTNLLYDALALPNIGAEFYLGKNLSVVGNWIYGWWDNNNRHRYWRAYGGDIALRWWFGRAANEKPLTGHHIGLYGGIFTYDFEFGGTGYMGGKPNGTLWDKNNIVAGVEYGYSLPIGRRLNIDFTLGIGYMSGQYYKYIPKNNCYVWQSTHNLRWFGPTKAEISLTWLIGRGNINK